MSLDVAVAKTWNDEQLLREYEHRLKMHPQLVGWLYRGIIEEELGWLVEIARERYMTHIEEWRDRGVVPTTWTDLFYVVHEWRSPCRTRVKPAPVPDQTPSTITCLECATSIAST